jgi:hypothetical protein
LKISHAMLELSKGVAKESTDERLADYLLREAIKNSQGSYKVIEKPINHKNACQKTQQNVG